MFEVFAYWNIAELETVFNAVAALTASSNYMGLLRVIALIGFLAVMFSVLAGKGHAEGGARFFIMVVVVFSTMLVPKVDVILIDRTNQLATKTVGNVPLGLAFFASTTSKIGDYLTRSYETMFSTVDTTKFSSTGLMFGSKMVAESRRMEIADAGLKNDLYEFVNNCTLYDIADGRISLDELTKSTDVWATMGKTSQARMVTYNNGTGFDTCSNTYTNYLDPKLRSEVLAAQKRYGPVIFPGNSGTIAAGILDTQLTDVYQVMLGVSKSSQDIMKQTMSMNIIKNSGVAIGQKNNDPSAVAIAVAAQQAEATSNTTYAAMAKVAESAMPKIRNIIELILYALFPIIVLFVMVAGAQAGTVLKLYAMALFNIQLWPVLYAVINWVGTNAAMVKMKALAGQAYLGANGGMSLLTSGEIGEAAISDIALCGYMTLLIPMIAQALVSGASSAIGSAMQHAMQPGQGAAQGTAQGLAGGNASYGNVTMDTSSYNMQQGNKRDMTVSDKTGTAEQKIGDGMWQQSVRGGAARVGQLQNDTGGISYNANSRITQTLTEQAAKAESVANTQRQTMTQTQNTALAESMQKAYSRGGRQEVLNMVGKGKDAGWNAFANKVMDDVEATNRNRQLDTSGQFRATAGVDASLGLEVPGIGGAKARSGAGIEAGNGWVNSVGNVRTATRGASQGSGDTFAERFTNNKEFRDGLSSSQEDRKTNDAKAEQIASLAASADASYARSQELRQSADLSRQQGMDFGADLLKMPEHSGALQNATNMLRNGDSPKAVNAYLDDYFANKGITPPAMPTTGADGKPLAATSEALRAEYGQLTRDQKLPVIDPASPQAQEIKGQHGKYRVALGKVNTGRVGDPGIGKAAKGGIRFHKGVAMQQNQEAVQFQEKTQQQIKNTPDPLTKAGRDIKASFDNLTKPDDPK